MKLWFLVAFFLVVYDICFAAKPVPLPFLPREAPLPLQSKSRASTFQQQSFPAISRQSVSGDGYGGTGFTVMPVLRNEEPATAILIHGLGGTGEELGFVSLALSFFSLNYVKFILPTAPTRPVTYLGNKELPSWYDIFIIRDFGASVNRTELLESVARVDRIIEGEIKAGVPQNRIFVLGFSQGGGVALTTFLRSSFNLAGCIGVATWLPLAVDYPELLSPTASNKQILLLHVCYHATFSFLLFFLKSLFLLIFTNPHVGFLCRCISQLFIFFLNRVLRTPPCPYLMLF